MITLLDYWMGRDSKFRGQFTEEIQRNGARTVELVNLLLVIYHDETGVNLDVVSSGWRPGIVNSAAHGAPHSMHEWAKACDMKDRTGAFPRWCARNLDKLERVGLYLEDWHWTPHWGHVQTDPPHSGHRMYVPYNPATRPPIIPMAEKP